MATSCSLTFYRNSKFYSHQNYVIDEIQYFLDEFKSDDVWDYGDIQYFKDSKLETSIKITLPQEKIPFFHRFNYAKITRDFNTSHEVLYYFVTKIEWLSTMVCRVYLLLDTLNTYLPTLTFSNRTYIERQHVDRWDFKHVFTSKVKGESTPHKFVKKVIPTCNEDLNPVLYPHIFKNKDELTRDIFTYEFSTTNPQTQIRGIPIIDKPTTFLKMTDFYMRTPWYLLSYADANSHTLKQCVLPDTRLNDVENADKYSGFAEIYTDNSQVLKVQCLPYYPNSNYEIFDNTFDIGTMIYEKPYFNLAKPGNPNVFITYLYTFPDGQEKEWNFPRQLSRKLTLQTEGFKNSDITYSTDNLLFLLFDDLEKRRKDKFSYPIIERPPYRHLTESALFSKEFLDVEFFYSDTTYKITLDVFNNLKENVNRTEIKTPLNIYFYPPFNLSNYVTFQFMLGEQYENALTSSEYGDLRLCQLQNEVRLTSSDYVNYMRNGYNYDTKKMNLEKASGAIGRVGKAVSTGARAVVAGGPAAFISGGASLITGIAEQTLNNRQKDIEREKQLEQKKARGYDIKTSGAGLDKLSRQTSLNKLAYVINTYDKKTYHKYFEDYFYFFGQKVGEYGIPTHNNRRLFDFLKCDAEFTNRENVPEADALNDVIARLKQGVTFIHRLEDRDQDDPHMFYFFDTENYENIERALF